MHLFCKRIKLQVIVESQTVFPLHINNTTSVILYSMKADQWLIFKRSIHNFFQIRTVDFLPHYFRCREGRVVIYKQEMLEHINIR